MESILISLVLAIFEAKRTIGLERKQRKKEANAFIY